MALSDAAGFWSYTRKDDELEGGRIRRLAEKLRAEFALLTGAELELFVDRDGIEWGDAWRSRIDEALAATTFFIPIITPRYFERRECRHELLTFIGHAKSLGMEELLLPILYVQVSDLIGEGTSTDEAVAIVAATQWVDWRNLRLEEEDSGRYRQAVNRLAARLLEVSERLADRPPSPAPAVVATVGEEDEPGLVDLMAVAEEALPTWQAIIEQFAPVLEQLNEANKEATAQVNESDARGGGFAGRLVVARRLGIALEGPADKLVQLGNSYASELVRIDPGILAMLRALEQDPTQLNDEGITELLNSIQGFAALSRNNAQSTRELSDTYSGIADISRVLRGPVRKIKQGLRGVLDGQSIIDEWDERIKRMRGDA